MLKFIEFIENNQLKKQLHYDFINYIRGKESKEQINNIISTIKDKNIKTLFNIIKYYLNPFILDKKQLDIQKLRKCFKNVINDNYIDVFINYNFVYNLSYFECDKKDILIEYHKMIKQSVLNKYPNKKNLILKKKQKRDKIHILFMCFDFKSEVSSVFRDRSETIKRLDKNIFKKYILIEKKVIDKLKQYEENNEYKILFNDLLNNIDYRIELNDENYHEIPENIIKFNFDIIIYPSIGMCPKSIVCSYFRMAPIQINTWGHSITSGIDTIDYYISSKLYEQEDLKEAQNNYSENLLVLNSLTTYYLNYEKYYNYEELKKHIHIPNDKNILFCMQTTNKITPEFIYLLRKIIIKIPNTKILFLKNNLSNKLKDEINNILNNNVIFINKCSLGIFNTYMYYSDLILDTYPFGGCNSSLEAFAKGKIVITRPHKYLPGRFTYGFYKKMNIMDAVVYSSEEYVNKVVFYIKNKEERTKLENKILSKKNILFNDQESVDEWSETLIKLYKKHIDNEFIPKLIKDKETCIVDYSDKLTILILTNRTHKSLKCLELLLLNLQKNIPELNKCNKLICHDYNIEDTDEYYTKLKRLVDKFENTEYYIGKRSFFYKNHIYTGKHWGYNILDLILKCQTPYFMFCEHDWVFTNKINFQNIYSLFKQHTHINYITFRKSIKRGEWSVFLKYNKELNITQSSSFNNHQYFSRKQIWTTDWIPKLIKTNLTTIEHNIMYEIVSFHELFKNWGLFFYGKLGDLPLIKHIDGRDFYKDEYKGYDLNTIDNEINIYRHQLNILKLLKSIIPKNKPIAHLYYEESLNFGDSGIWLGQEILLNELNIKPVYICSDRTYKKTDIKGKIGNNGVILFRGGGNFGDLYEYHQLRLRVMNDNINCTFIQFPQSVKFNKIENIKITTNIIKKVKKVILLARDNNTFDFFRKHFNFNNVDIILCCDMAFCIGRYTPLQKSFLNKIILKRTDQESKEDFNSVMLSSLSNTFTQLNYIHRYKNRKLFNTIIYFNKKTMIGITDWYLTDILDKNLYESLTYYEKAEQGFKHATNILALGNEIVTDRLHAFIFGFLINKKHTIIDNSYGKVSNFYNTWLKYSKITKLNEHFK
jgi:pyruvyl transferase EpsO